MHIIFGDNRKDLPDNYTILELDQFKFPDGAVSTAYCVVENVPLGEFQTMESYQKIHHDLMEQYRARNWEYCQSAIKGLTGRWNGELDSFYENLFNRVEKFIAEPPAEDWDGTIVRNDAVPTTE
jgi:hypothetical protein